MTERVLALIDASGESDSSICRILSLGNGIIGKWRKGLQKPPTEAIIKISLYFKVSTDYLLIGKETKPKQISKEDDEWLELIHQLPSEKTYEFKGELKGYLRRMEEDTVAAESPSDNVTKNSLA